MPTYSHVAVAVACRAQVLHRISSSCCASPLHTCMSTAHLQAEQLGKVERWSLLEGEDLTAALKTYPAAAGALPCDWCCLMLQGAS